MTKIRLIEFMDQLPISLDENEPTTLDKGDEDLVYDTPNGPIKKYTDQGEAGAGMGAMLSVYDPELSETLSMLDEMTELCENSWI
jgi:hypothetical protein